MIYHQLDHTSTFGIGYYRLICNSEFFSPHSSPFFLDCHFSGLGTTSFSKSTELHASRPSKHVTFDLRPPKSFYKALFHGTELGETLRRMSLSKAVPEGLKSVECECGIGGKNSPIRYIPEQDPIQEALETKYPPTTFKLSLPSGSEMRIVRWASGTPEHFLIHVQGAIHAIKEKKLDTKFQEASRAVESAVLEVDVATSQYKDELKEWEEDDASQQTGGAHKATLDKSKQSRSSKEDESPPDKVITAKAALNAARKARNQVHE